MTRPEDDQEDGAGAGQAPGRTAVEEIFFPRGWESFTPHEQALWRGGFGVGLLFGLGFVGFMVFVWWLGG